MNRLRRYLERWEFAAFVALLVGFAASWRLQFEQGTIGLFHDWSISPAAAQNVAYASQLIDGWYRWILGEPVIYPTEYPVRFAFAAAGLLGLNGDVVSHAFVFLVPAMAFFSAWLLTRQLSGSAYGATAGGILYALSPVMLNKMVSGQASYVVGYCALPLALWAYERAVSSRSLAASVAFGTTLAIAGVQVQLGLAGAFLAIVAALVPHRAAGLGKRLTVLFAGVVVALAIHLPTIIGVAGGAPGYEDRAQFSNSVSWLSTNSVSLPDALRLVGYLTRYADVAVQQWASIWNFAMWIVIASAFFGILAAEKRFRIFSVVVLIAVFALIPGTQSPFSAAVLWLFEHVRYMQVFRELYHLMAVVALIYACGIALFFGYLRSWRFRWPLYVCVSIALLFACAPMLSGDASGWMRAFPLQQAYGDALHDQLNGPNRVLWLPMDQPLSFDGHGAGVDPMSITPRGSLWDYALNWPLTAVDADLHNGGDLTTALRALSVGDVVERYGMQSELYRYTIDGADSGPLLARSVRLNLRVFRRYRQSTAYVVPHPIPLSSAPREIALVPQRLDVCASAIVQGYAPIAYSDKRPEDLPYAMVYDPQDQPEEAVDLAGATQLLPSTSIDARKGFAPVNVWWWHRKEYADVPNLTLSFGRHVASLVAPASYQSATIVVGWIATPAGGHIRISVGGKSVTLDTGGNSEWRSRAIDFGPIDQGAPISLTSLDTSAEVAIRAFTVLERKKYRTMLSLFRRTLSGARPRIPIVQNAREILYRTGASKTLGILENGGTYRFIAAQPAADARIVNTNGYTLARIVRGGAVFTGTGTTARINFRHSVGEWRLYRVAVQPLRLPPASAASRRLLMWNWAFGDWRTGAPAKRFRSAIGTTIFEFALPQVKPVVRYSKSTAFRLAYIFGILALLLALCMSFLPAVLRSTRSPKAFGDAAPRSAHSDGAVEAHR